MPMINRGLSVMCIIRIYWGARPSPDGSLQAFVLGCSSAIGRWGDPIGSHCWQVISRAVLSPRNTFWSMEMFTYQCIPGWMPLHSANDSVQARTANRKDQFNENLVWQFDQIDVSVWATFRNRPCDFGWTHQLWVLVCPMGPICI
jgi:hypothetical protein